MTETHILSGLVAKRAELVGEVEALEDRLGGLRADLFHLDATINIVSPGFGSGRCAASAGTGPASGSAMTSWCAQRST